VTLLQCSVDGLLLTSVKPAIGGMSVTHGHCDDRPTVAFPAYASTHEQMARLNWLCG